MAKYLLVVFLTVVTSILCRAQQKDEFPGLTKQDRKNYVLSVDTNQTRNADAGKLGIVWIKKSMITG